MGKWAWGSVCGCVSVGWVGGGCLCEREIVCGSWGGGEEGQCGVE